MVNSFFTSNYQLVKLFLVAMIPKVINKFLNLFSRMQSFSIYATFKIVITDLFCRYEPNTIDLDQDEFKYSSISLTYRYIIESFDDI